MTDSGGTDQAAVLRLSWAEVCARRLDRHGLSEPVRDGGPADVVAAMCGAHAQVLSAAELSVGIRIAGVTRVGVRDALWRERSLVKTFGPRGTVHLLATRDLPLWTGALSAIPPSPTALSPEARLTPEQADAVVEAIAAALSDTELTADGLAGDGLTGEGPTGEGPTGEGLTVDELTEAIVARTGGWAGDLVMPAFQGMWPRWRQAIGTAANRGALCFGPNRGRKVTYTSPHRWLPGFRPADARDALTELVRRYLHAYGPATPHQFAQWLAAPRRWATELFDSLSGSGELDQVDTGRILAWVAAGDTAPPPAEPRGVRLLPYFDAYTVGCHPRDRLFPGRAAERALSGGQAGNFPVLLIDGTVAGVWHQRRTGQKLDITVEPFARLTAARRRELGDQVDRIGQILEAKPRLTIGTVTVGGHA